MLAWLIQLVADHLKFLVSLAFIAGVIKCVDFVVKVVDMRLPDEKKSRFGIWVASLGPRLDALTIESVFKWAKRHWLMCAEIYSWLFVLSALLVEYLLRPVHDEVEQAIAALEYGTISGPFYGFNIFSFVGLSAGLFCLLFTLHFPSQKEAWEFYRNNGVRLACSLAIGVPILHFGESNRTD